VEATPVGTRFLDIWLHLVFPPQLGLLLEAFMIEPLLRSALRHSQGGILLDSG
jgi:hypothetical protein